MVLQFSRRPSIKLDDRPGHLETSDLKIYETLHDILPNVDWQLNSEATIVGGLEVYPLYTSRSVDNHPC